MRVKYRKSLKVRSKVACVRLPCRSSVRLKKHTLVSSKNTFSGVMLLYCALAEPLAEAWSRVMKSP